MSVNALPKFNRGGLSGTTFGQRSSEKTTSGTSKQKAPSSISVSARHYSLKKKNGIGTEISRGTTPDYTALRRTNSTRTSRFVESSDSSFMTNAAVRMGMIQGAYGMQAQGISNPWANLAVGIGQSLFGGVQQTRSAALDGAMNSLGGGKFGISDIKDPGLSTAALAMTGATDYQSLSSAIGSAEAKLTEFKAQGPSIQSAAQDATKNLSSLEGGMKAAENAKTTASNNVGKAKQGVQGAEAGRMSAQGKLTEATKFNTETKTNYAKAKGAQATAKAADNQAQANVTSCTAAHDKAQTALADANATLAKTDEYITITNSDGTTSKQPNPAYAQAKNAVKMAEAQEAATKEALTQAEAKKAETGAALDKANEELTNATNALKDGEQAVVDADTKLNDAIKACEDAETKVGEAEQGVREAEVQEKEMAAQYDVAKDNCDRAKDAIAAYKDYEQNAQGLENTIKEQKDRLSKMGKQDEKDYKDLKKKGDKRTDADNNRMETLGRSNDAAYAREVLSHGKGKDTTTETVGNEKVTIGTNPTTGHKVYVKSDGTIMNQTEYEQLKGKSSDITQNTIGVPADPFANQVA